MHMLRTKPTKIGILLLFIATLCLIAFGTALNRNIDDTKYILGSDNGSHMATGALITGRVKRLQDALNPKNHSFGLRPPLYSLFLTLQTDQISKLPNDVSKLKSKTDKQLFLYLASIILLCLSLVIFLGRAWLALLVVCLACTDMALMAVSLTLRSHSLTASMFILSLAAMPIAIGAKGERGRSFGWLLFGLFIALTALTRLQYQYTLLPLIPVLYLVNRHEKTVGRRLINVSAALLPLLLLSFAWYLTARSFGTVSRHEKGFLVFMGKSVAPNYYTGEDNTSAQNAIAELWNSQMLTGSKPSAFPNTALIYYRDNFAPRGVSVDALDAHFSKEVKELAARSLIKNYPRILGDRWTALLEYLGFIESGAHRELPRSLKYIYKSDLEKLSDSTDRIEPLVTRIQFEIGEKYFPWFYELEVGIMLFGGLLLVALLLQRWIAIPWLLAVVPALYVLVDLTMVGFGFNGPKRLYKIMDIFPFWFCSFVLIGFIIEGLTGMMTGRGRKTSSMDA